ncbi:hypothetical protein NM688_g2567 [Phlebia brevispora]|uniref:Uncharacterized protein n=1 Tax=Phlebia brevispora TaxID=194682 RepID=A0ACC1T8A3_9APHY|nr:hypothetical protein NM688_g2567 [Phlebia brevispora]
MSYVWNTFGDSVDEGGREVKNNLLPNAYGVVLDIGAGYGHTVKYLDLQKVTKYVALEPNVLMHDKIRKSAAKAGLTEETNTLLVLPYGAEDIPQILDALGGPHSVDTLVSILTLCSIPSPSSTIRELVEHVLKPGGQFLIYEHVLSPRNDVAWWQRLWTPVWRVAFDGCCLDRPTHLWIQDMDFWDTKELWGKDGEDEENLWWHQLKNVLDMLFAISHALQVALIPTMLELCKEPLRFRFLQLTEFRRVFMAHLWILYGPGIDGNDQPTRATLITPNAHGAVLDIGAGHGHVAKYLDRQKVARYIAMEPNPSMHDKIRELTGPLGFTEADSSLVILPYGAEQINLLVSALGEQQVDTMIAVGSLCSVPEPIATISALVVRLLKPGGELLFIEHVRSPRPDVAWWQAFWAPVWRNMMDGCTLGRPTDKWIDELDVWESKTAWTPPDQPEERFFWRRAGRYVKQHEQL